MRTLAGVAFSALCLLVRGLCAADSPESVRLDKPAVERWQIGLIVHATGACSGIAAAIPAPMDWPEQQVKIVDQQLSEQVGPLRDRTLDDGVKQMLIVIPRLAAGDTASVLVTFEITKSPIEAPDETSSWRIPVRPAAGLRPFLGASP